MLSAMTLNTLLSMVATTTTAQHRLGQSASGPRWTPPNPSVPKAGNYQPAAPIVSRVALLEPVMWTLSRLSIVATTAMARSTVPAPAATGGRLPRTIVSTSTTCTTMVVAWIPAATTTGTMGTRCGVSALASNLYGSPDLHGERVPRPGGRGQEKIKSNAQKRCS